MQAAGSRYCDVTETRCRHGDDIAICRHGDEMSSRRLDVVTETRCRHGDEMT